MKQPKFGFGGVSVHVLAFFCRLAACLTGMLPLYLHAGDDPALESRFDAVIHECASRHRVDPLLVKALIWRESRFNPNAVGRHGEIGLMQLRGGVVLDWARAMDRPTPESHDIFDPYVNVEIGSWYLARALKYWEKSDYSLRLALWEYNAGRSGVRTRLREKSIPLSEQIAASASGEYIRLIRDKYLEYLWDSALLTVASNPVQP